MEWFLKPDGEAVFGEIGARPPGARLVHAMNYTSDVDLFRGWAEAVCHGRLSQDTSKRYNTAIVFKRAEGAYVITEDTFIQARPQTGYQLAVGDTDWFYVFGG